MQRKTAFSLVELLVVVTILSVLCAVLLPAFLTMRGKARELSCSSNLRQTGIAISLYAQDCDGLYPFAVDPFDRAYPVAWQHLPEFEAQIPTMSLLQDVLQPYVQNKKVFQCPSDIGFLLHDFSGAPFDTSPSSYDTVGTSYYYRTEIAARGAGETTFGFPGQINVLWDGAGHWHGTLFPIARRYNVLFADGHVKNLTAPQLDDLWMQPLSGVEDSSA